VAREGTWRAVVLPAVVWVVAAVAFVFCLHRAVADTRFADDLHGGYGGLGAGLGVGIMTDVAARRTRRRVRESLPSSLREDQRDQVMTAVRSGPLPADPVVRVEARRLAERWAAARGSSPRVTGLVAALLAVGLAVAGVVSSVWWWGDAAVLASLAGVVLRRDRQLGGRLRDLRQSTELPEPPPQGVHRLVDSEPAPDLTGSGRGLLELRIRTPWGGGAGISSTMVRIDGSVVPSEWGTNRYLVPAGTARLTVWIEQLSDYGHATTTVTVLPGQPSTLHYSPPALTFLAGRLGAEPQRSAGARGLGISGVAFVAVLVGLIVLFP
jgi:hypothetical protein